MQRRRARSRAAPARPARGQVFTRETLRTALLAWLEQFAGEAYRFFWIGYASDWDLLVDLLGEVPAGWQGVLVGELIDYDRMETYFRERAGRHHTLGDARALLYARQEQL